MAVRFPRRAGAGIRITATRAWALAKKRVIFGKKRPRQILAFIGANQWRFPARLLVLFKQKKKTRRWSFSGMGRKCSVRFFPVCQIGTDGPQVLLTHAVGRDTSASLGVSSPSANIPAPGRIRTWEYQAGRFGFFWPCCSVGGLHSDGSCVRTLPAPWKDCRSPTSVRGVRVS